MDVSLIAPTQHELLASIAEKPKHDSSLDRENPAAATSAARGEVRDPPTTTAPKQIKIHIDPHHDKIYKFSWGQSPIIIERYKLVFFTMPKVACSEWKRLFRRIMGYEDWLTRNPHDPRSNGLTYLFQYNVSQAEYVLNQPGYTRAIFVRDPKEKFLSAYLDKAVGQKGGSHVATKCCKSRRIQQQLLVSDAKTCLEQARASLEGFFNLTSVCNDTHWGRQSDRMEAKYWQSINFVGHMSGDGSQTSSSLARDAKRLLQTIGAWQDYGQNGWGKFGNESLFASKSDVTHATSATLTREEKQSTAAMKRLAKYYTPSLELAVEERFAADYDHPMMGLVKTKIQFSEPET